METIEGRLPFLRSWLFLPGADLEALLVGTQADE